MTFELKLIVRIFINITFSYYNTHGRHRRDELFIATILLHFVCFFHCIALFCSSIFIIANSVFLCEFFFFLFAFFTRLYVVLYIKWHKELWLPKKQFYNIKNVCKTVSHTCIYHTEVLKNTLKWWNDCFYLVSFSLSLCVCIESVSTVSSNEHWLSVLMHHVYGCVCASVCASIYMRMSLTFLSHSFTQSASLSLFLSHSISIAFCVRTCMRANVCVCVSVVSTFSRFSLYDGIRFQYQTLKHAEEQSGPQLNNTTTTTTTIVTINE